MRVVFQTAALAAAVALSGCVTTDTTVATLTPQEVYVGANAFDAVEATATSYLTLPLCPQPGACRTAAATNAIVKPIRLGRKARSAIEAYVAANPGASVPVSLANALSADVASLQAVFAQYGVQ